MNQNLRYRVKWVYGKCKWSKNTLYLSENNQIMNVPEKRIKFTFFFSLVLFFVHVNLLRNRAEAAMRIRAGNNIQLSFYYRRYAAILIILLYHIGWLNRNRIIRMPYVLVRKTGSVIQYTSTASIDSFAINIADCCCRRNPLILLGFGSFEI